MQTLQMVYGAALKPCHHSFTPSHLLANAEAATGLSDWGGEQWGQLRFLERLELLCRGLEQEARLDETGRSRAHSRLHVLLCSRLRQVDRHRDLAHVKPIVAPLVGTGLPRAGTTFLHGLLASDRMNRVATATEAALPNGSSACAEQERIALYERILAFQGFTDADVTAIHPYSAVAPEECVFLQEAACGVPLGAFYNVPSFAALAARSDAVADSYAWQKGMMQSLQDERPEGRWLLKAPSHIINIEALFATFPDARLFINHRDPGKVIPSMASLYMKLHSLVSGVSVDAAELGHRLVANWKTILDRMDAWRIAHPEATIVDVHYTALIADPIGTAERLYAAFDLPLSEVTRQAMRTHLAVDHHGKGPARQYCLADFGLAETDIEEAFGHYIERHGVLREARS